MTESLDASAAGEVLREAAGLMREDPERSGSMLTFGRAGQVVMTGDMHGNIHNFEKLQRFCALERSPGRRVILHELIHEEPPTPGEMDLSIDLLVRAATWKCAYPDNVFSLQSNHELSQLYRHEITKGGRSVVADFERGVHHRFGTGGDKVLAAVDDYLAALPLAARTGNGVFLSHSLPDPLCAPRFDATVFDREPTRSDVEPGGSAYALVWGRFHSTELVEELAQQLGAGVFVVGHTPQEMGYAVIGRMIILASDHSHGTFLPIDLHRQYTADELAQSIRKFVAVE